MKMNTIRTYSELSKYKTLQERFEYLRLDGTIGEDTFGFDRYLNQMFYRLPEWKKVRRDVIIRDNGCELGVDGFDIMGTITVHHMNPITKKQILEHDPILFDKEYLISVSSLVHKAIHYGDSNLLPTDFVERRKNDTCPWRHD